VGHTRSALIVASYDYENPGLRRLRAPARDAEALAGVLRHPDIGGFEVRTILNQPEYVISEAVEEFFADRTPDDLLLLYFSCHGIKDDDGQLYFAASNTKPSRLGATAVASEFVNRCMSRSRSRRVVLLLDCCYAGAFERGMVARAGTGMDIQERFGGRGRAVITASSAMEYAFEGDELADGHDLKPSVFTSALVQGLETGDADRDEDGNVGLDELYEYVYGKVREVTPSQTPGKWTFGVEGDLYIARRNRPVTKPAALPPELQQAIDHPLPGVRLAAVQELEGILRTRHAGLALAARLALEGLVRDDSRNVSAAAEGVLARSALEPPVQHQARPATDETPSPTLPPRGREISIRQWQWWLGVGALVGLNVVVTLLVVGVITSTWYQFLPPEYLPNDLPLIVIASLTAAAWSVAYAATEATSGQSTKSAWRHGLLPQSLEASYRDLLGTRSLRQFLRALIATPPVNVVLLFALCLVVAALAQQYLGGSSAREYLFVLVSLLLNGAALSAVFRPNRETG
jgi:caspase domain-containing protein